ncbi:caspase domain-containing protein [Vannielia litorea]|uniref:caspase family protein n=1 Tax=Vannielia litorea TaxID=1217970 RepID=UPI001C98C1F1|nr:caspase family protein [Vannielia litorea]MBY6049218.1 caspase family protein [Vannielia litorea]MBY6076632.1 caspase family protein [Vannielia litorea]
MTLRHLSLATLTALACAAPVAAETRALLIGVGDYEYLDADLRGPVNDVALMARTLMSRGVAAEYITVLTTAPELLPEGVVVGMPRREAILNGLAEAAEATGEGDTVFFYFSGHGSQAPDLDGDDQGGYDEILLPSDASGWKGTVGAVENAILDDELRAAAEAIMSGGAALVAVLDACHAATGFRAMPGKGAARYIEPTLLGIPEAMEAAESRPAPALEGQFAFLYSSQSDQRSFEYPHGDPDDPANWYGEFTRVLTTVMASTPDLTWEQLLTATMDGMRKETATATQTPDGEGTFMAAPVFGGAEANARLRVDGELKAGALAGLTEGSEITFYAAAAGGEPLGTASITGLTPLSAALSAVPQGAKYAEVTSLAPAEAVPLRLSTPVVSDGEDYTAIADELARLEAEGLVDGVAWNAEQPDRALVLTGGQLAVTGPDGVLDPDGPGSSPRFSAHDLAEALPRLAQVQRLEAALTQAEAGAKKGFTVSGPPVKVEAEMIPADCDGATGTPIRPAPETVPHCAQLWLHIRNTSSNAQDVTVLYRDKSFTITAIFPGSGTSNRLNFNETVPVGMLMVNEGDGVALEEVIVLVTPAEDGAPRTALTGLANDGQSRGASNPMEEFIQAAAAPPGEASRNFSFSTAPAPLTVTRIPVRITPKDD